MHIKTREDIKKLGTILGVWAHPDDDIFSMGMIMAAAAINDQRIECIIATRGEAGVQDESRWPVEKLGQIRSDELAAAYEVLGHHHCHWLDYPDGGCADADHEEAIRVIARIIQSFQPDTILTFGPDGMTGHADHIAVSHWASEAVKQAGSSAKIYHSVNTPEQLKALERADKELDIFFNTEKPPVSEEGKCDIYLCNDNELCDKKLEALKLMPSQTEKLLTKFGDDCKASFGCEAFVEWN